MFNNSSIFSKAASNTSANHQSLQSTCPSQNNSLQLDLHQLLQLQSILSPDQLQKIIQLQQQTVPQQQPEDIRAEKLQNGRVCKVIDCTFCTASNCGKCGNCLHPDRKNKCIRRYQ
jgi:hypothetical protein